MKKNIYTPVLIKYIIAFLLLAGLNYQANATHVVGSDITYKCTSTPGIFEVTLVVYRDCNGATLCPQTCGAPCNQTMSIQGADPGCASSNFGSITLQLVSVRDVAPELDCPNAKNQCTNMNCVAAGTFSPSVERYEWKGFANVGPTSGIPSSCCNVRFSWSLCCRNSSIRTGAADQNFYVDAIINRCHSVSPCNSSPELSNDPYALICGGENYVFNNGAIDPDFDSLSFAFTPALQSFGGSVTYLPPFAFDKPMPWTGNASAPFPAGIRCDPLSGDIMFTPGNTSGQNFIGVMAIEIKQWKTINGVPTVIGVTRRDIQMVVLANCPPNNPPRFMTNPPSETNPNAPRYSWEVCADDQLCFTVTGKDTDFIPPTISDTTKLSWNGAIASLGATFVKNYAHSEAQRRLLGPREDQYRFCWTPTQAMASTTPYYFTLSAKDSRCPKPGRVTRAFSVKVIPKADVILTKTDLKCGKWRVRYDRDVNKPGGKASLQYTNVTWVIARVPNDFSLSQNPYVFINTATPPDLTYLNGGKYIVQLQISTPGPQGADPCTRVFRDTLNVDTVVQPIVSDTFTCIGNNVQLRTVAKYGTPIYSYRWYNSIRDTAAPPLNNPNFGISTITVKPNNSRYYTIQVRDINGCRSFDSIFVDVKPLPVSSLIDSMRICNGDTFTLNPGNNTGNIRSFTWSTGDTTQTIARQDSGRYVILLTDTFGCQQRDTMMLFVNRPITPNAGLNDTICLGDSVLLNPSGGQMYQWRLLNNNSIVVPKQHGGQLWVKPTNTTVNSRYELTAFVSYPDTTSKYKECAKTDTVEFKVNVLPQLARPQATLVCRSTQMVLLPSFAVTNGQGGGTGLWSYPAAPGALAPSGTQLFVDSLVNNPKKDTNILTPFVNWVRYAYTSPSQFGGCTRVDSAQINMYANPAVDAGSRLNWCTNGGIYPITGVGNRFYRPQATLASGDIEEWTGNGIYLGTANRYFFNPLLPNVNTGNNIINYKYTRNYNNLITCQNEDTVIFFVTAPPVIDAGSDILVCANEPLFNIATKAGATITPNTGAGFWRIPTPAAADAAIINGRQDFNASAVVIPNNVSSVTYKTIFSDTSTGCTVRDSINIQVARVPRVRLVYDNAPADSIYVCQNTKQVYFRAFNVLPSGFSQEINATPTNSTLTGSSAFTLNTNLAINNSRAVFNSANEVPGQYNLKYTFADNSTPANCVNSDSNTIYVLQPPTIDITATNEICAYDTISDVTIAAGQPTPSDVRFRWTPVGDGSYLNDTANATQYITGVTDRSNGAAVIRVVTLNRNVNTLPGRTINAITIVGNGEQCAPAQADRSLIINRSPIAAILATNPEGCEPLTTNLGADNTGVPNPLFRWEWENNARAQKTDSAITETQNTYDATVNGLYRARLIVTTSSNPPCADTSDWQTMQVRPLPEPTFVTTPELGVTTIAKPFFTYTNQSTIADNGAMAYKWNLGPGPDPEKPGDRFSTETNPTDIEYAADTALQRIVLTATSEYGCIDSFERFVRIDPDITIFVPNAFRPGSIVPCQDGSACNSQFLVAADGHLSIEIFVFNRWGQQVFYTNDAKKGWDGTMNNSGGEACPQDVYIYQINASSFSNKKYKYSGSVTLLR